MLALIQKFGRQGINSCIRFGKSGLFLAMIVGQSHQCRSGFKLLVEQLYRVGVLSLFITVFAAIFIGMVLGLEGYHTLERFGATEALGQLIALSVVRELGPVITALLFAGRAGSALTAEIGLMRATEQLDCMAMMAVNPVAKIIAPRFWAGVISLPILTILFNLIAIDGGQWVGVHWLGLDSGTFWSNMQSHVNFGGDILNGVLKSIVFGVMITWIAVYQGYYAEPNAAGISRATTKTVVYASLMTLAFDFILTAVMMGAWH